MASVARVIAVRSVWVTGAVDFSRDPFGFALALFRVGATIVAESSSLVRIGISSPRRGRRD